MKKIKTRQKKKPATVVNRHKRLAQKRAFEARSKAKEAYKKGVAIEEPIDKSTQENTIDSIEQRAVDTAYIAGRLLNQRGKRAVREVAQHFEKSTGDQKYSDGGVAGSAASPKPSDSTQFRHPHQAKETHDIVRREQGRHMAEKRAKDRKIDMSGNSAKYKLPSVTDDNKPVIPETIGKKDIRQPVRNIKVAQDSVKKASKNIMPQHMKTAAKINAPNPMKESAKAALSRSSEATGISAKVKAFTLKLKNIIESAKFLLKMALAAGWLAIVAIIAVTVIAFIVASPLGVFFSGENGNSMTIPEAMQQFDAEFRARIQAEVDELSAQDTYESVEVIYEGDGDGDTTNNWSDVVTVYAVKYAYDSLDEVITFDEVRKDALREIFDMMNGYDIRVDVVSEEVEIPSDTTDQSEIAPANAEGEAVETESPTPVIEIKKHLKLYVTISSSAYTEAAVMLGFTAEQMELADEMMSPEYYELFAALFGVDLYDGTDVPGLINDLPPGTKGEAIVKAALTRLGDPYSQSLRGQNRYVDCSYLAWWAYQQAGVNIPMTSVDQAKYCADNGYTIGQEDLQPGDLVFWSKVTCSCGRWQEIHHVGIYIGDGKVIEASYGKGRVVISKLYSGSKWQLHSFGRPHI